MISIRNESKDPHFNLALEDMYFTILIPMKNMSFYGRR